MKKYVALLRGINVGGNCKISMSDLKKIFESCGLQNVSTYINSGNVIFASSESRDVINEKINKALRRKYKFEIKTLIRTDKNIGNICKKIPSKWKNDSDQKTDILFLWDKYDNKRTLNLIKNNSEVDNLKYIPGSIAWNIKRSDYNRSGMKKFIGTEIYKNMTARNINTVRKLSELMK